MSIAGDLDRARRLAWAADESGAKDLLLSLLPAIEQADRDDLALEVFAQLGEIYLVRTAYDGVGECTRRIRDCIAAYAALPECSLDTRHMMQRYTRRADFLQAGLHAARGEHDEAAASVSGLLAADGPPDLADEHRYLVGFARLLCAIALSDDDLHHLAVPLWEQVLDVVDVSAADGSYEDRLLVLAGIGYGGFCVQTGRLDEAGPWLQRAGARAQAHGWELDTARTQLERAIACWSVGDHNGVDRLIDQAYPVIARYARAHDVSRCWFYRGFTRLASAALEEADQCWEHAERHWRELGKPLYLHRILLQRSWIPIFFGRFGEAVELIAQARSLLDEWPRSSWLQYARLDDQLGTVWRADALGDLGFDGSGDPEDTWDEVEAKHEASLGTTNTETGSPGFVRAMAKLEQAAELKVPAALAVDSVRYTIIDANDRAQWATRVSAPMLAGAFAVSWEWENTALTAELIEYHSARGSFSTDIGDAAEAPIWAGAQTVLVDAESELPDLELADVAAGSVSGGPSLTRLGPLPPLQMDPGADPILGRYRALAKQRYGRTVTTDAPAWPHMVVIDRPTLILRFADVGIATYASLRVVGQPERTVTWVVEETILLAALEEVAAALPDPRDAETAVDALQRALSSGAFTSPGAELTLAYRLGVLLISAAGWDLVSECVHDPRAVLFVAPSARLGRVPWGLLALPAVRPEVIPMLAARQEAITPDGPMPATIPWPAGEIGVLTEGFRLLEFVDVLMAVPANIAHSRRTNTPRPEADPLLILDPRVPGQRPDSTLGSVLGRPAPDTVLARHYADLMDRRTVVPRVGTALELFRRTDTDRHWLADVLSQRPGRLVYVGHASTGDGAERAALHLACRASVEGCSDPIGDHRPLTAADLMSAELPLPTRVALLACASGGDYRFDEATGMVAAMVLGGAELVTATLWSLPTSAGYRRFVSGAPADPMGELIAAVDTAHQAGTDFEAACAVNRWQRAQLRRWRDGDDAAAPVYWAALVSFAVR